MQFVHRLLMVTGFLIGVLLATSASRGEETSLQVGDPAPVFQCLDDQGRVWNSRDYIGKKMVIVYFYPSDFSFCCTRQAVRYRDRLRDFCNEGVEVVGISGDVVQAHRLFQATHKLNFTLLSDDDGSIASQFGVPLRVGGKASVADEFGHEIMDAQGKAIKVPRQVTAARWTFVINREGRVIYRDTEVSPVKDSQVVLDFLRKQ